MALCWGVRREEEEGEGVAVRLKLRSGCDDWNELEMERSGVEAGSALWVKLELVVLSWELCRSSAISVALLRVCSGEAEAMGLRLEYMVAM